MLALPMILRKQSRERKTRSSSKCVRSKIAKQYAPKSSHFTRSVVVRGGVTWKYLDVVFRWGLETSASQTNLTQIFSPFSSCWPSTKQGSDLLDWIGFQIGLDCGSDQTVISTFSEEEFLRELIFLN